MNEPPQDRQDPLDHLPVEVISTILSFLSAEDLCHLGACNKAWQQITSNDNCWSSLCKLKNWERFGVVRSTSEAPCATTSNCCTVAPFSQAPSVDGFDEAEGPTTKSCDWKEVYVKAWHLERSWSRGRRQVKHITESFVAESGITFVCNDCSKTIDHLPEL
ncbi:F-box/WD repeat-containing protein pof1-like [Patiria miniata]|uniref:F-box domain-containing protein n=1 Tax=Patiria miniata TaxID=46514 RepID=A0A914BRW1_PATMI|nr:F-box/WD repeat-containing protein pof1-like [Patiria miniata]